MFSSNFISLFYTHAPKNVIFKLSAILDKEKLLYSHIYLFTIVIFLILLQPRQFSLCIFQWGAKFWPQLQLLWIIASWCCGRWAKELSRKLSGDHLLDFATNGLSDTGDTHWTWRMVSYPHNVQELFVSSQLLIFRLVYNCFLSKLCLATSKRNYIYFSAGICRSQK